MNRAVEPPADRRQFLLAGLSVVTLLSPAGALAKERDTLERWLRRVALRTPEAAALGRRYLHLHPTEGSAAQLAQVLFGMPLQLGIDGTTLEGAKRRIRADGKRDYEDGNLVVLEGWSVTRTEARLLALLTILSV